MMTNIITLPFKKNALINCKEIKNVLSTPYQTTCITSTSIFFSILFLCKNDDDLVRGGGKGGRKVMIGIIIGENDNNWGPAAS